MERRVNKCINEYTSGLKLNVKKEIIKIIELTKSENYTAEKTENMLKGLLQYVCDYDKCELKASDFEKRKRSKNNIPIHEQCMAKKANNSRCTRRKRENSEFCGTHIKGTPHGVIGENVENNEKDAVNDSTSNEKSLGSVSEQDPNSQHKKVEVWLEDIGGIMHYIDNNYNVYENEDIIKGVVNPRIIYKYEKDYVNGEEIFKIQNQ